MSTSRYIQRITTQEEVFLRWLVREETFSHTLRARISSVTEHLSSSLVLESNNNKLVNKLNSAFENIESWIIKISTPAAAVAVCSGALMRKFSFGDEEKIRTGKKLITGSLFSYAFILAIDLILSAIQSLVG